MNKPGGENFAVSLGNITSHLVIKDHTLIEILEGEEIAQNKIVLESNLLGQDQFGVGLRIVDIYRGSKPSSNET